MPSSKGPRRAERARQAALAGGHSALPARRKARKLRLRFDGRFSLAAERVVGAGGGGDWPGRLRCCAWGLYAVGGRGARVSGLAGCYGLIGVPETPEEIAAAEAAFPDAPVEVDKAWPEMVHRISLPGWGRSSSAFLVSRRGARSTQAAGHSHRAGDRARGLRGVDGDAQALAAGGHSASSRRDGDIGDALALCADASAP